MPDDSAALSAQKRRLLQELLAGGEHTIPAPHDRIPRRRPQETIPLSIEQTGVWLHSTMAEAPLYNESFTLHRHGRFDIETMQATLDYLIGRHEIWRTAFVEQAGTVRAVVDAAARINLEFVDLTCIAEQERDQAAIALATEDARRPFDLSQAPLVRVTVVRLAADRHRLYFSLHHIVFDGVSIYRVLVPELAVAYAALSIEEIPQLPLPSLQYGDYAVWQRGRLQGVEEARCLDYWRRQLAELPPDLKLPVDRLPAEPRRHEGGMLTFDLPHDLTARLKGIAASLGATFYAVLLASFKALLHRYSQQNDIVIGGVVDTRLRSELQQTIGYFLNGVALRSRPRGDKSFSAYLGEVQTIVLEAVDAAGAPFDQVVRTVRPHRQGSNHPLYQVLFSIQPPSDGWPDGWDLTQMDVATGSAKFDLYLELDERRGQLIGRFLYDRDLFDEDTVGRMAGHWRTLLEAVAADPQIRLADLPILTLQERRTVERMNAGTAAAIPDVTIDGWFRAQASKTPASIAIEAGSVCWTYERLRRRSRAVAACLRQLECPGESVIGIAMDRTPEMVAGLLGILEAGCCYLPLDPDLPTARLALLIDDAKPAALLSQVGVHHRLPPYDRPLFLIEDIGDRPSDEDVSVTPDDLAYILYTSGSTGRPKAVEIEHRSVVNLLAAMRSEIGFDADDRLLSVTTISFDIAALEIFLPLVTGGRLVLAGKSDVIDPRALARLIDSSRASVMQATPALWRTLIQSGWEGRPELRILCGGEALSAGLARELRLRTAAAWNVYGPTETTIWSLVHKLSDGDDPVPIGKPLANTSVHVLDASGLAVPAGVPGELLIGGAGLARRYRGDPGLAARRFVSLPDVAEGRLYRTGDQVKMEPDGTMLFLGRIDNQVKIRGFRVELEEVERVLVSHAELLSVAVKAVPDPSGEKSLVAFIVPRDQAIDLAASLSTFLRQQLPSYMVPRHYVAMASLPLTVSGKIDRARLPDLPATEVTNSAPAADLEKALVALWQELLQLPKVGLDDDFFDLGGHSLLAFTMLARIRSMAIAEPTMSAFFAARTIRGLANLMRLDHRRPAFSHLVPLRSGRGDPLFIVHGVFGNVLQLAPLAMQLETERPVIAIQARGVDPALEPHRTIDAMVKEYLEAIRGVQPKGPYSIAGYSFGGLVAFEMACRLRASGEPVSLMALLETDLHYSLLPPLHKLIHGGALATRVIRKLFTIPPASWGEYLQQKTIQLRRALSPAPLEGFDWPLEEIPEDLRQRYRQMYAIGLRAFRAFAPSRFDGHLHLFMTTGPRYDTCDPRPIWRRAARSLEVIEIPGEHTTIMDEANVPMLAARLSTCMLALSSGRDDGTNSIVIPTGAKRSGGTSSLSND